MKPCPVWHRVSLDCVPEQPEGPRPDLMEPFWRTVVQGLKSTGVTPAFSKK